MPLARSDHDRALDRRILALAWPALGAIAAEPLYNLADTAVVGRLGSEALGALAAAWPWLGLGFLWASYGTWLASRTALLWRRWHRFLAGSAQLSPPSRT